MKKNKKVKNETKKNVSIIIIISIIVLIGVFTFIILNPSNTSDKSTNEIKIKEEEMTLKEVTGLVNNIYGGENIDIEIKDKKDYYVATISNKMTNKKNILHIDKKTGSISEEPVSESITISG